MTIQSEGFSQIEGFGKRARTRDALLAAAQSLLLERPAAAIAISDFAARAGVSHGTFYNYFESIDALLDGLGELVTAAHGLRIATVAASARNDAERFAIKTRQTLRFIARGQDYGRLLFDAGLPIDRLAGALREDLFADINAGAANGAFRIENAKLSASLVAGAVLGAALDLHRGRLPKAAIDDAAAEMLQFLGVSPAAARRAVAISAPFTDPPALPLTWKTLMQPASAA